MQLKFIYIFAIMAIVASVMQFGGIEAADSGSTAAAKPASKNVSAGTSPSGNTKSDKASAATTKKPKAKKVKQTKKPKKAKTAKKAVKKD